MHENVKCCTLISHFASATGALPLDPTGGLTCPRLPGVQRHPRWRKMRHRNPGRQKI